jgi:hypothetical protein
LLLLSLASSFKTNGVVVAVEAKFKLMRVDWMSEVVYTGEYLLLRIGQNMKLCCYKDGFCLGLSCIISFGLNFSNSELRGGGIYFSLDGVEDLNLINEFLLSKTY